MGIIEGLTGNASSESFIKAKEEFGDLLVRGEEILGSYKWMRDSVVFTTHRIMFVDKKGLTGWKKEYLSIPYDSITKFSKETL